jgi:Skp family chaperone for outer membrane proteins
MKIKSTITLFAAGLVSLAAFSAPAQAEPNHSSRFPRHDVRQTAARQEIRGDRREIRNDRAELGRDQAELGRDRADLRNLYRNRASRGDIDRKRAEIRQDAREINQDRREIRGDYAELGRDRGNFGSGNFGRFGDRQDWNRQDSGSWGRGWDSGRDWRQ